MDLNELIVFAQVVRAGGFSAAGRDLGMPRSTVSRRVADLEERLGSRLLQRTTRKMNLTDVGRAYYQHCARILSEVQEAEASVLNMQAEPKGLLRISVPTNFGFLGPIITDYLEQYAEVQVEADATDRVVDLIEEGYDAAVRVGTLPDSSLISRRLGHLREVLVASQEYVERRGEPESPEGLDEYECLLFSGGGQRGAWELHSDLEARTVKIRTRFSVSELDLLQEATLAGLGIAALPAYRCVNHLRSGRLRRILPAWCTASKPIQAVYPSNRHPTPKLKVFLEVLQTQMAHLHWDESPKS